MTQRLFVRHPWIIPVILFTILVAFASRMHPLWTDEAETAILAKSILQTCCLPKGWDGVNIVGMDAVYLNRNLISYSNPPLQYYVTAASFAIFGPSDWAARLPFTLFSIASLILLYYLAHTLTRSRPIATLSVTILALSVPFVLFSYQVRYYPLIVCFGLLFLLCAAKLNTPARLVKFGFVLAAILYAYSHYVSFAVTYVAFGIAGTLVMYRGQWKAFLTRYIGLGAVALLAFAPWYLTFKPHEYRAARIVYSSGFEAIRLVALGVIEMLHYFNQNNAFPFLLYPMFGLFFIKPLQKGLIKPLALLLLFSLLVLTGMATLYTFINSETPQIALRHNILLMPVFAIALSLLLAGIRKISTGLFWIVLVLLLGTNVFTLQNFPPISFLWRLTREIRNPYPTPDVVAAQYLNDHAQENDTVFVNLEQGIEPLIYYTTKQLRFVNRVRPNNPKFLPNIAAILPEYIYRFRGEPDWIILFSKRGADGTPLTIYNRAMPPGIDLARDYTETVIPVFFYDLSQPDIEIHAFDEVTPEYRDSVFIYRKKT